MNEELYISESSQNGEFESIKQLRELLIKTASLYNCKLVIKISIGGDGDDHYEYGFSPSLTKGE